MPRFLVTERVYVDAPDQIAAIRKVRNGTGDLKSEDSYAERVAPELEVGMPVRLRRDDGPPRVHVPVGSEGVVVEKRVSAEAEVLFHARHASRDDDGCPWTLQIVRAEDLEVIEGWQP